MGMFDFTEEDLARSKRVTAGWYPVVIVKVEDKPSAGDQSRNTFVTVKGLAGDARLVEVSTCFNEKANSFSGVIPFIKAIQNGQPVVLGEKYEVNSSLEGRQLDAYIAPGTINKAGDIGNTVKDWRPSQEAATA
jgi:hypothetical protein